ncbi:MAG: GNAT family N-acetyltransferase, partial [Chloroflexi bacterium]|nr:GNAT family N-acetyltransferase [Chloroflexota bacterium]
MVLRPAELNDAESFLNLAADNIDRLSQALGIWDPPPTVEERRKLMAGDLESVKNGDRHWWMIESEGRLAGAIDIHAIQHRARWGLVGYWLSDRFTGRGIMTRSLQAVIDWAFAERDFVRIEIQSSIDNRASCAVPERLGIRRESIRRQSQQILGRSYDMASYVAFADNWPPKPPDRPLPARTLTVDDEILLRQGKVGDRDSMWNALDTGRNYLGKYLPWMSEYKTEDDHKRGFNRRQYERDLFDGSGGYIVEYRDELAGSIGFGAPNRDNGTEVDYWLREDLQGRGIMTRSVEAVITMLIV